MSIKKFFKAANLFLLLSFSGITAAASNTQLNNINAIIQQFGHDVNIGIVVQSLNTGKMLYQRNANVVYNTASAMKIFPAAAALNYLGADYSFITQLSTDALITHGILTGNLYLQFTGDPTLTTSDLNNLINSLTQKSVQTINGDLIIDDTILDRDNWGSGWMWDELPICYAAPATAIIIDHNCFDTNLIPARQANTVPALQFAPTFTGATITNQAITKKTEKGQCPLTLRFAGNNHYRLQGCVSPSPTPLPLQIALNDPMLAAANTLTALLKQHHIQLKGRIITGKIPGTRTLIASHHSAPLSEIITQMLKKSDNLMAGVLFKTLGANYFHTTGTWANGAAAVQAILTPTTNINFNHLTLVDGSGLSRYNLVTPMQFIKLLDYAYYKLPAKSVFYHALPIMGIDGTLKDRLNNTAYAGKIHAKTGTMASTSTLVGYVQTNHQQTLAFAILINNFTGNPETYQALEDEICKVLIQNN